VRNAAEQAANKCGAAAAATWFHEPDINSRQRSTQENDEAVSELHDIEGYGHLRSKGIGGVCGIRMRS
jgi:poly(3-hydroxybutyrate) depolymerase